MAKMKLKKLLQGRETENPKVLYKSSIKKKVEEKVALKGTSKTRYETRGKHKCFEDGISKETSDQQNQNDIDKQSKILKNASLLFGESALLEGKCTEDENTIFVGNLPQNTKKVQLMKLFSECGPIKSVRFRTATGKKLYKHKTRKEAQFLNAYLVMCDAEGAKKAVNMSGCEFKGHHLRITQAIKSKENGDVRRTVFVGNLKYSATDEKLFNIFSSCGKIEYVRTLQSSKGCKGVAYICFKKPESVSLALELNNTILDERPIRTERYSKNKLGAFEKQKDDKKQLVGASRRIKEQTKKPRTVKEVSKENKKSEYRGLRVDSKKKLKKKKKPGEMVQLARKIAPLINFKGK